MINREKLINAIIKAKKQSKENALNAIIVPFKKADMIIALLKEKEKDKPKGHWMSYEPDKRGYTNGFTCSRCERVIFSDHYCKMIDFDFCPYCGAYMDNAEGR